MSTILLQPRPYASYSGKLILLPLLPRNEPVHLPPEIWVEVFKFLDCSSLRSILTVCKDFKDIALPLVYEDILVDQVSSLALLHERIHSADQKWDSLRRIPYSTPGRWVQSLDLSFLPFTTRSEALRLDSLLSQLFPLLPFLAHLRMSPSFSLSRRAITSLADRDTVNRLQSLTGLRYSISFVHGAEQDPFLYLIVHCRQLRELELVGEHNASLSVEENVEELQPLSPLILPNLHTLTLLTMALSPVMLALLNSHLPSLKKLTLTPYHDIPYPLSLPSNFIITHGENLRSLTLITPKSWPTRLHPSPPDILQSCVKLHHLSLETPVPDLALMESHNLQILSLPRPSPDCWRMLLSWLPHLPRLSIVRARELKWLRKGMNSRAQETGVQGEMREWSRRLARRRIRFVDAAWKELDV